MPPMKKKKPMTHRVAGLVRVLWRSAAVGLLVSALPPGNGASFDLDALAPGEMRTALDASFIWSPAQPTNYTRALGARTLHEGETPEQTYSPAVRIHTQKGRLIISFDHTEPRSPEQGDTDRNHSESPEQAAEREMPPENAPVWRAELVRSLTRRQPNGEWHPIRHVLLSCEAPGLGEEGRAAVFLQQLEIDATRGSVDLIPCTTPARYAHLPARDYQSLSPTGLPEKINGSAARRDMLKILYALAAIDSPEIAKGIATELGIFARKLSRQIPEPREPWPMRWGEAREDAREVAEQLTPTLLFLQINNCFDCAELADFINSPEFGAIFGESFTNSPADRVQEEPIEYLIIPTDKTHEQK